MRQLSAQAGFSECLAHTEGFPHRLFLNLRGGPAQQRLHVYLEGDGSPWLNRRVIAADPTPRHPLMLELMTLDPGPSVYLGRPCYHGLADAPGCGARQWTSGRYAEEVIDSLETVLRDLMERHGFDRLDLFGHSGGGTLAVLLGERLAERTDTIVTLAGNLDVAAWSAHHGFSPLHASLDPAKRPPLPPAIRQRHYAAAQDRNVPPAVVQPYFRRRDLPVTVIDEFDHACCWQRIWPSILKEMKSQAEASRRVTPAARLDNPGTPNPEW